MTHNRNRCGMGLVLTVAALGLWPALAGAQPANSEPPRIVNPSDSSSDNRQAPTPQTNMRDYTLRNTSNKTINTIRVRLAGSGAEATVNQAPITPNHNQSFAATQRGCLSAVRVEFEGGSTLEAKDLSDCNAQTILVTDDKITVGSSVTQGDNRTMSRPEGTPSR